MKKRVIRIVGEKSNKVMPYIIFIDMDDVLADFRASYILCRTNMPDIMYPQSVKGFFENLASISGAIEAVNVLRNNPAVEPYVLTAPSTRNPHSYTEKRLWIEKHFDYEFTKKLIICHDKSLMKGDLLIDDNISGKGQEDFDGRLIHFGSLEYPDWDTVISHIEGWVLKNKNGWVPVNLT